MARSKLSSGKIDGPATKVLASINARKTPEENEPAFRKLAGMFGRVKAQVLVRKAGKARLLPESCMG